ALIPAAQTLISAGMNEPLSVLNPLAVASVIRVFMHVSI
ncbi:MAG: hypothetical protein ACI9ZT_001257, partial [Gammaproteobacteria bacterium]